MPSSRMANDNRQGANKLARGFDSANNILKRPPASRRLPDLLVDTPDWG